MRIWSPPPPVPGWQTDPAACAWAWQSGGGIGFWAERCELGGALWAVVWDAARGGFVQTRDGVVQGLVVQPLRIGSGPVGDAIHAALVARGAVDPAAACRVVPVAAWPMPDGMTTHALTPIDAAALAMTPSGEVPDPLCGPYGVSTHGVRFLVTDRRWPGLAVFVEAGQERPLFDPASLSTER
jgi:hypothetical protein